MCMQVARKLLTTETGHFVTLGMQGDRKGDVLQLAIDLENKDFVAHRHCQYIAGEQCPIHRHPSPSTTLRHLPSGTSWASSTVATAAREGP